MKIGMNKMPTTIILLIFSWLIAVLGFLGCSFLILLGRGKVNSLISGLLVLLGGILAAVIIRMLANIGQILFDSRDINQNISQIKDFFEQIERHLDLKK